MKDNITLEEVRFVVGGKGLILMRPKKLDEIFRGNPFEKVESFPLWFKVWEASLVLADYLSKVFPPKAVLELGCGLGIPSIVGSAFGHKVLATDYQDLPLQLVQEAAKRNNLHLNTKKLNWLDPQLEGTFDLIVSAEIVYREESFSPLLNLFKAHLREGGEIVLSHSWERVRVLIPFLNQAQREFIVKTSIRRLSGDNGEVFEVFLNRLTPKKVACSAS